MCQYKYMFHFYHNLFDIYNGKTKKAKKAKDFSYMTKKKNCTIYFILLEK